MEIKRKYIKGYTLLTLMGLMMSFSFNSCVHNQNSNQLKENKKMEKTIINPWTWQDKYGFVQANEVKNVNRTLYTAGIVSVDEDGNLLYPNDMEKQINQILDNIETILNQADFKLSDVVRFTYYTTDVQEFTSASHVLATRLGKADCKPATSLIGVKSLFHPDCIVEIEATVVD
jgi:enamine deaminase RidA (YjgF/YER057c/UK114 family)